MSLRKKKKKKKPKPWWTVHTNFKSGLLQLESGLYSRPITKNAASLTGMPRACNWLAAQTSSQILQPLRRNTTVDLGAKESPSNTWNMT